MLEKMKGADEDPVREKKKINFKLVGVVVPLVIAFGLSGFFFFQWQQAKGKVAGETTEQEIQENEKEKQRQLEGLVEKVNKLILLPDGEVPTLLPIEDAGETTRNLEFLKNAEDGDKVLVYKQAKKAYLYRPSENRIINVGSVTLNEDGEATEEENVAGDTSTAKTLVDEGEKVAEVVSREYTFAVRNGAGISGIAGKFKAVVEKKITGADVVEVSNMKTLDYQESLLVSFIDDEDEADRVAAELGIRLGGFPTEEEDPDADFLVIVGRDKAEQ